MRIIARLDKKTMCNNGLACPAIMRADNGDILVIGTDVTNEIENLAEFEAGCAPYERIVRVPKNVFDSINRK